MSRMNCIVKIRGQLFEIEADGDWGGGDQGRAIEDRKSVV